MLMIPNEAMDKVKLFLFEIEGSLGEIQVVCPVRVVG